MEQSQQHCPQTNHSEGTAELVILNQPGCVAASPTELCCPSKPITASSPETQHNCVNSSRLMSVFSVE